MKYAVEDGLRCHVKHKKFHKNWISHSEDWGGGYTDTQHGVRIFHFEIIKVGSCASPLPSRFEWLNQSS
jgi:hypothetical protein